MARVLLLDFGQLQTLLHVAQGAVALMEALTIHKLLAARALQVALALLLAHSVLKGLTLLLMAAALAQPVPQANTQAQQGPLSVALALLELIV